MEHSEQINEIATALAKAQGEFTNVPKKSTARIKMDNGSEYTYTYAKLCDVLDMVRGPLAKNGLAIVQGSTIVQERNDAVKPEVVITKVIIETTLVHSSGQFFKNTRTLPAASGKNQIQAIGSTESYGRRYDISNMLGIASEDDPDGAAQEEAKKKGTKPAVIPSTDKKGPAGSACEVCHVAVSDDVKAFSQKKFNKVLCMTHQPKGSK